MKAGKEHRVPLSDRALTILDAAAMERTEGDFVFPGPRKGKPLSNMAMAMLLRVRMKRPDITVHGFRSSFRDWAGEETSFPREVAEAALAHTVGDEVERAYRRADALEKRRKLMDAWAKYVTGGAGAKVVPIRAAKGQEPRPPGRFVKRGARPASRKPRCTLGCPTRLSVRTWCKKLSILWTPLGLMEG